MDSYNAKSCSALEKPFYRPVEAALRWCNLLNLEHPILAATGALVLPPAHAFPQYPCLRLNAEKIFDAIENGELPHGRNGRTVATSEHVAADKLTVRHTDLKAWMAKHCPDQKPKFLFDEIERNTHAMYNAETFHALQAEKDAAKATIEVARQWAEKKVEELNSVRAERDVLAAQIKALDPLTTNERNSLLRLVIGMAMKGYTHDPAASKNTAPKDIADDLAALGMTITDDTVRKYLKLAADTVLPAKPRQP